MKLKELKAAVKTAEATMDESVDVVYDGRTFLTLSKGNVNVCLTGIEDIIEMPVDVQNEDGLDLFSIQPEDIIIEEQEVVAYKTKLGFLSAALKTMKSASQEVTVKALDSINLELACGNATAKIAGKTLSKPLLFGKKTEITGYGCYLPKLLENAGKVSKADELIDGADKVIVSFMDDKIAFEVLGVYGEMMVSFSNSSDIRGSYSIDRAGLKCLSKMFKNFSNSSVFKAEIASTNTGLNLYLAQGRSYISLKLIPSEKDVLFPVAIESAGEKETLYEEGEGIQIDWDYYQVEHDTSIDYFVNEAQYVDIVPHDKYIELSMDEDTEFPASGIRFRALIPTKTLE